GHRCIAIATGSHQFAGRDQDALTRAGHPFFHQRSAFVSLGRIVGSTLELVFTVYPKPASLAPSPSPTACPPPHRRHQRPHYVESPACTFLPSTSALAKTSTCCATAWPSSLPPRSPRWPPTPTKPTSSRWHCGAGSASRACWA